MKDHPGLLEQMRRAQREEWTRPTTTHSPVPMYDFVTRAAGDDYKAKMSTGEWEDLTAQVAKHLPPEQALKPGERIVGHRCNGARNDTNK